MYHWSLDYVLDHLTFKQVIFFYEQAAIFLNPDAEKNDEPDREKLHRLYGNQRRISR